MNSDKAGYLKVAASGAAAATAILYASPTMDIKHIVALVLAFVTGCGTGAWALFHPTPVAVEPEKAK